MGGSIVPYAPARMKRLRVLVLVLSALSLAACGEEGITVAKDDPLSRGAQIFDQRCSACHTLRAAGGQGSSTNVNDREYKDGPNFNQRAERYEDVLYAIRNGGFSSGPMPQNIVVGEEAEVVARFVDKYSGRDSGRPK
jgi:mono/diheme cytochrome c family protein